MDRACAEIWPCSTTSGHVLRLPVSRNTSICLLSLLILLYVYGLFAGLFAPAQHSADCNNALPCPLSLVRRSGRKSSIMWPLAPAAPRRWTRTSRCVARPSHWSCGKRHRPLASWTRACRCLVKMLSRQPRRPRTEAVEIMQLLCCHTAVSISTLHLRSTVCALQVITLRPYGDFAKGAA